MTIEEIEDGERIFGDPLAKGIVIFPDNQEELKVIKQLLTEEGKVKLNKFLENESI
jgi:hypothetical protein